MAGFSGGDSYAAAGSGSVPTGTAGSPNASVVTVQGIAGGTSLPVTYEGGTDVTEAISLGALNATAPAAVAGLQGVAAVITGTWSGTITPEWSVDDTNWEASAFTSPGTTTTVSATISANGTYGVILPGGAGYVRLRMSSYTSGTATGTLRATTAGDDTMSLLLAGVSTSALQTTGNTTLSTIATDLTGGSQKSQIVDGSGNVIGSSTSGTANALATTGVSEGVTFSRTTAQAVAATDAGNYRSVSVQITAQGGSSTVTFQCSNDNSNWYTCSLQPAATVTYITATTGTGIWSGPLIGRYFRLNVTGIASGTTSGVVQFFTAAPGFSPNYAVTVSSGGTIGLAAGTSGGSSIYSNTGLTSTVVSVKSSAGNVYGYVVNNPNASTCYVQFFNLASGSVTLGSTTPTWVLPVPGGATANICFAVPIAHATAISMAFTTTSTGSTAPSSNACAAVMYE